MTTYEALQIEKKLINNKQVTDKEKKGYKKKAECARELIMKRYEKLMIDTIDE
jgi:hypothetical protein